jgi:hypothetical protein
MLRAGAAVGMVMLLAPVPQRLPVETLKSVGGLPAHVAGRFNDIGACEPASTGDYLVFDRRAHMVFAVPASMDGPPREVVGVGVEPGRVLNPSAFDLAPDRTFVVADTPFGQPRVQFFFEGGARFGGFELAKSTAPRVTAHNRFINLIASVRYTGKSVFISQPETGSLMTEYSIDGRVLRAFGELRPTGQEADRDVHLALNMGRIVLNPQGGFYYVFIGGAPMFRKYDAAGKLIFERHIQGLELDDYVRNRPSVWAKRGESEIPLVMPAIRTADADAAGDLWISLAVPFTYVYDERGEKNRVVQFAAAGPLSPDAMTFTTRGRLFVMPGCYAFDTRTVSR